MIRLAVRCPAEQAEVVLAELIEMAPGGLEQVDAPDGRAGLVEYAIYGAEGELPDLGGLRATAGADVVEVDSREVPDDWAERWKRFYFPVLVAGRLYLRPPWERAAERGGVEEVVIDPGGAFGTGTHPTTRMCLELLLEVPATGSFTDLGCGSGVLSIAAAKLGFEPVLGVDADQAAIEETDRNARANGVQLDARRLDLRAEPVPVADVMAANLTTRLCEAVAAGWAGRGERPGTLIASGFLREEADRVAAALGEAALTERRRMVAGDWAAILAS
ncbi:MAG TPA: 50S ribosomal protein L11 methyltransferase [Solirubrobacterales bacterium]|nr:50S ribosomal protein L11 methyltransferase [Solirubrobacterales bacterium]